MCSGTITSHSCKLRDPWEHLSIATVVLGMGKLTHGEGLCSVSQSKIQESHLLAPCITHLPISSISSLICSTEAASCICGLAQVQDQAGKAAGTRLNQSCSRDPRPHLHLQVRHFHKCCSEENFPAPSPETEPLNSQPPGHQERPSQFALSMPGQGKHVRSEAPAGGEITTLQGD